MDIVKLSGDFTAAFQCPTQNTHKFVKNYPFQHYICTYINTYGTNYNKNIKYFQFVKKFTFLAPYFCIHKCMKDFPTPVAELRLQTLLIMHDVASTAKVRHASTSFDQRTSNSIPSSKILMHCQVCLYVYERKVTHTCTPVPRSHQHFNLTYLKAFCV